jgi:hypothetical protein
MKIPTLHLDLAEPTLEQLLCFQLCGFLIEKFLLLANDMRDLSLELNSRYHLPGV